jgi:hypothetical protein
VELRPGKLSFSTTCSLVPHTPKWGYGFQPLRWSFVPDPALAVRLKSCPSKLIAHRFTLGIDSSQLATL